MRRLALLTSVALAMPVAAHAEDAAGSAEFSSVRDTIIVTARRRPEDVQLVPASISVVAADTLEKTYTVNINQISQMVPTLNYSSPNPRNTAFTIRGLGSSVVAISQANDGLEPGVGFYVNQVYHARPATAAFDLTDLDQVEVLRGPQGTVFGKNTTAGEQQYDTARNHFDPVSRGTAGPAALTRQNPPETALPIDQRVGPAGSCTGGFRTQAPETLHNVRRFNPHWIYVWSRLKSAVCFRHYECRRLTRSAVRQAAS